MASAQLERQGSVTVRFLEGDRDKEFAQIYGTITGSIDCGPEITLFDKSESEAVKVARQMHIPLLTNKVYASDSGEVFKIQAKLCDYDCKKPNAEIANGSANYGVRDVGGAAGPIAGQDGKIYVGVNWTRKD